MDDALAVEVAALASVREDWAGHHFETFVVGEEAIRHEQCVLRAGLLRLATQLRGAAP